MSKATRKFSNGRRSCGLRTYTDLSTKEEAGSPRATLPGLHSEPALLSWSRLTHPSDPFRHLQVNRRPSVVTEPWTGPASLPSGSAHWGPTGPPALHRSPRTSHKAGLWAKLSAGFSLYAGGSDGQESAHHAGELGSIPGLGRSPGEGNCCPC